MRNRYVEGCKEEFESLSTWQHPTMEDILNYLVNSYEVSEGGWRFTAEEQSYITSLPLEYVQQVREWWESLSGNPPNLLSSLSAWRKTNTDRSEPAKSPPKVKE